MPPTYSTEQFNHKVTNYNKLLYFFQILYDILYKPSSAGSHLKLKHGVDFSTEPMVEHPKQGEVKEDCVCNYACVRLSLGMLILNFNDAVKEGDGKRILRCWKYMLLLFKGHGHNKYALAALRLLANTKALLPPPPKGTQSYLE